MVIFNFLKNNSRILVWVFLGLMVFWAWNQSQERKMDAQRIAALENTVTQLSSTVNQMAITMQQTADLMQRFNTMAASWEEQRQTIAKGAENDKAANTKDLQANNVGAMRIPDSVINRLRGSAEAAKSAADSAAVSADSSQPAK